MKKWLKYILIGIVMFMGANEVGAKKLYSCEYDVNFANLLLPGAGSTTFTIVVTDGNEAVLDYNLTETSGGDLFGQKKFAWKDDLASDYNKVANLQYGLNGENCPDIKFVYNNSVIGTLSSDNDTKGTSTIANGKVANGNDSSNDFNFEVTPGSEDENNYDDNSTSSSDKSQATNPSCGSSNINTNNWKFVSTESSFDPEFLNKEVKTDSTLIKCCQLGAGQTLRYYCDTYNYIGDPEDNQIENVNKNEDLNVSCPSDYDRTNYSFSYNKFYDTDVTNKSENSIVCCKQVSHVGGSSQYSCNIYTSNKYIEDLNNKNDEEEIKGSINGCDDLGKIGQLIRQIYNLLKYLIPILVIGLSIVDFLKVVINGEEKVFKEAWTKFIKRIIIGIIVLILPVIISFIINVSGVLEDYGVSNSNNSIFCIFR